MIAKRGTVVVSVMLLGAAAFLHAEVIPGRWEKVEALNEGSRITVLLDGGERLECTLRGTTEDHLSVATLHQSSLTIPKKAIRKVAGPEIEDSNRNGTWIGAGIGFAVGFGSMVAWEKSVTASGYQLAEENLGFALAGGLVGGAAGALVGNRIDAATRSAEILYRAP